MPESVLIVPVIAAGTTGLKKGEICVGCHEEKGGLNFNMKPGRIETPSPSRRGEGVLHECGEFCHSLSSRLRAKPLFQLDSA